MDDAPELVEFKRKSLKFVSRTLAQLVDFIVESGRDRFTYIKESLILPTATPPRPGSLGDATGEFFGSVSSIGLAGADQRSVASSGLPACTSSVTSCAFPTS